MIQGMIIQDQEFRHIATGNVYTVLTGTHDPDGNPLETLAKIGGEDCNLVSAQDPPGWVPCIVYYDGNRGNMTFVRDEAGFREKFERI